MQMADKTSDLRFGGEKWKGHVRVLREAQNVVQAFLDDTFTRSLFPSLSSHLNKISLLGSPWSFQLEIFQSNLHHEKLRKL